MLLLRATRTSQPAQPGGVDWANRLTRGLLVAISGSKPYELVNGVALRTDGGPTMVGATPGLHGPRFNGSSGVLWAPIPRTTLGNWTLLQVVRGNSPATDRRSFNVGDSTNNSVLVAIGTGTANAAKVRAVGVNNSGTAPGDTSQTSSADAFVNSGVRVVALRLDRDVGYQCFVNGVPDGFAAFSDPTSAFTVDRVGVGALYRGSAAAFFSGDSFAAFAWSRALSDAEIAEVSRNPWQLFAPAPRRLWAVDTVQVTHELAGAGAASVTGSANLTTAIRLTAAGAASATGTANLTTAIRLNAAGSVSLAGVAALLTSIRLAAAGNASLAGAADLTTGAGAATLSAATALNITTTTVDLRVTVTI